VDIQLRNNAASRQKTNSECKCYFFTPPYRRTIDFFPNQFYILTNAIVARMTLTKQFDSKRLIAGILLALWVAIVAISGSPQLHHAIHPDSASSNHECLIQRFSMAS
jgi:hypothetical protein